MRAHAISPERSAVELSGFFPLEKRYNRKLRVHRWHWHDDADVPAYVAWREGTQESFGEFMFEGEEASARNELAWPGEQSTTDLLTTGIQVGSVFSVTDRGDQFRFRIEELREC